MTNWVACGADRRRGHVTRTRQTPELLDGKVCRGRISVRRLGRPRRDVVTPWLPPITGPTGRDHLTPNASLWPREVARCLRSTASGGAHLTQTPQVAGLRWL